MIDLAGFLTPGEVSSPGRAALVLQRGLSRLFPAIKMANERMQVWPLLDTLTTNSSFALCKAPCLCKAPWLLQRRSCPLTSSPAAIEALSAPCR